MTRSTRKGIGDLTEQISRIEVAINRLLSIATPVPEFVTVIEAARRMGIGEKTLRGAVRRGEIRSFALGTPSRGRPRVRLDEVREWAMATAFDPQAGARRAGEQAARRLGRGRATSRKERKGRKIDHG